MLKKYLFKLFEIVPYIYILSIFINSKLNMKLGYLVLIIAIIKIIVNIFVSIFIFLQYIKKLDLKIVKLIVY